MHSTNMNESLADTPLNRAIHTQHQNIDLIYNIRSRINSLSRRLREKDIETGTANVAEPKSNKAVGVLIEHLNELENENRYLAELQADLCELENLL